MGVFALIAVSAWSAPSSALTIHHNGYTLNKGDVAPGKGKVKVGLADLNYTPVGKLCGYVGADVCLGKVWGPGSVTDTHRMRIKTDYRKLSVLEFVVNATGTDWTDYHFGVKGGYIAGGFALVLDIVNGSLDDISGIGNAIVDAQSAWLFFDQPFGGFDKKSFSGQILVAGGLLIGNKNGRGFGISQHPSIPEPGTLGLIGFGLTGIGALHRRRKARKTV